jgi:hypothetical protein
MTNNTEAQIFNKVYMTPFFNPKENVGKPRIITYTDNANDIKNSKMKHGSEAVGFNNKVSPYYDVDIPIPFDTQKEEIRRLKEEKDDECFKIIVAIWSDYKDKIRIKSNVKEVRIIKKQGKKYYKISLRYYVKGVMMKNKNKNRFLEEDECEYAL